MNINDTFARFARAAANGLGSPLTFAANFFLLILWFASGPIFNFSDTWQLLVNTATTVFTYLAVFIIQNTQNRDAKAIHLKLDELISSIDGARNRFLDLENLDEEQLQALHDQFKRLQLRAQTNQIEACRAYPGEPDEAIIGFK